MYSFDNVINLKKKSLFEIVILAVFLHWNPLLYGLCREIAGCQQDSMNNSRELKRFHSGNLNIKFDEAKIFERDCRVYKKNVYRSIVELEILDCFNINADTIQLFNQGCLNPSFSGIHGTFSSRKHGILTIEDDVIKIYNNNHFTPYFININRKSFAFGKITQINDTLFLTHISYPGMFQDAQLTSMVGGDKLDISVRIPRPQSDIDIYLNVDIDGKRNCSLKFEPSDFAYVARFALASLVDTINLRFLIDNKHIIEELPYPHTFTPKLTYKEAIDEYIYRIENYPGSYDCPPEPTVINLDLLNFYKNNIEQSTKTNIKAFYIYGDSVILDGERYYKCDSY